MNPDTMINFIRSQDRIVQVTALKALANSLLAQLVGNLRAALRNGTDPLELADMYRAWAVISQESTTLAQRQFEETMDIQTMVDFFKDTQPVDESTLGAVSETTGMSEEDLRKMHQNRQQRERQQLEADENQILNLFESLANHVEVDGYDIDTVIHELSEDRFTKLVNKLKDGLNKAVGRLTETIVGQGRSDLLSDLQVLKAGAEQWHTEIS